jgi:hypothetical protein
MPVILTMNKGAQPPLTAAFLGTGRLPALLGLHILRRVGIEQQHWLSEHIVPQLYGVSMQSGVNPRP